MATTTAAPATTEAAPATTTAQPAPVHNSSLYVGDLDREVTEAQLYELFQQVGPVASIRVCRDAVTRRSLGYAYVNYNSALDPGAAERALEQLNYAAIGGRPVRIMWSHRDPLLRKSGVGNIFIKNLDKSIDNKALHDTFNQFGNILSCKVAQDAQGQSKGYGFVHFETEEAAQGAIQMVNGKQLEDKIVYVGPFLKRNDRPTGKERFTNIYIKNIDTAVSDEELATLVNEFGPTTSVAIMRDDAGNSKGFGFVNFDRAEDAARAVEALHEKEVKTKRIWVGRAMKKGEREAILRAKHEEQRQERIAKYTGMNLYIKNLVDEIDDDKLREEFAAFGTVTSSKVMRDERGKSKGFGFVCYSSHEEAQRAVTELNGRMIQGKPLYVALAQRKEVRRAQLEQQMAQRLAMASRPQPGPGGPLQGMYPGPASMMYPPMGPGGPAARPGAPGMMFQPPMMQPRAPMGAPQGRGPRGPMPPPNMMAQQPGMMMMPSGPAGPGAPGMAARGRGGRGGRGPPQQQQLPGKGPEGPAGAPPPGGRGRGFAQGRGAGRAMQNQPLPPSQPPPPTTPAPPVVPQPVPAAPAPPPPAAPAAPPPPPADTSSIQLTASGLANASPEMQKQMLGERLFPMVHRAAPELAGKITGMLLEMDNSELLILLESPKDLTDKVQEAILVLKQHNAIPEGVAVPDIKA